ncbi:MAG: hypothetical protein H8E55_41880 [Pelagibacterales bacterium]|nr:hypothetical protein [Pelagibacterales bacterium]
MICEHKECLLNRKQKSIEAIIDKGCADILDKLRQEYPLFDKRCMQKVLAEDLKDKGEYLLSELVVEGYLEKVAVNEKR